MTNKKAIRLLRNIDRFLTDHVSDYANEDHQAIIKAIKALEKEKQEEEQK